MKTFIRLLYDVFMSAGMVSCRLGLLLINWCFLCSFQLLYLEFGFYPQLTLRQLIQPDQESQFSNLNLSSQLVPSIQSGSSPCVELQVVTPSTHLSKDYYPQLLLNPHRSKIQPPKQLDYWCMPRVFTKWLEYLVVSNTTNLIHSLTELFTQCDNSLVLG